MPLTLSLFASRTETIPSHLTLPDLRSLAEQSPHERHATKAVELWSPAQYLDGKTRAKENVYAVHLLVFDVDEVHEKVNGKTIGTPLTPDDLVVLVAHIDSFGFDRWVHSTWSYTPEKPKCRIVISLTRPVLVAEWQRFFAQATHEFCPIVDPSTKDASRIFYPPSCPMDTPEGEWINDYQPGVPLDVDALLARAPATTTTPLATIDAPPVDLTVTDRMREASSRRAEQLARRIRTFPQGSGIYALVRDAAYELGGRVGAGALSVESARGELRAAHRHRNPNPERVREKDALIEKCLAEGATRPWCPSGWYDTTDAGLSGELIENHGAHIRYIETWSKWIGWNGRAWDEASAEMALAEAVRSLTDAMRAESDYANEARTKSLKSAIRSVSSAAGFRNTIYMAKTHPKIRISHAALDADPWTLATPTGAIDLRTGHLHQHDPARLTLGCTNATPDSSLPAPYWFAFLDELTEGDPELTRFLQIAMGYSLTGFVEPHALFLLTGGGGNGKGVFIRAIKHALGSYAISASPHLLLQKRSEQHATGIADLYRKRIATIAEVEEGKGWDEVELKALVDSDKIRARRMREDAWEFDPTHHFWVSGNYTPNVRGVDNGVWRRLFLIPCASSKVGLEDLVLKQKLEDEAPRILAWAIEGCIEWQRRGRRLEPTTRMIAAKASYRDESDPVGAFVLEKCDVGEGFEATAAQVYTAYCDWAMRNGEASSPPTSTFLGRRLARYAKHARGANGVRKWVGLRMRTAASLTTIASN